MGVVEMIPILIVGPRRRLDVALEAMAGLPGVHPLAAPPVLGAQATPPGDAEMRLAHVQQEGARILRLLRLRSEGDRGNEAPARAWSEWDMRDIEAWIERLGAEVDGHAGLARDAAAEMEVSRGYLEAIQAMAGILEPLRTVPGVELTLVVAPRARKPAIAELVRALGEVVGRSPDTFQAEISGERTATLLVLSAESEARLRSLLAASGLTYAGISQASQGGIDGLVQTLSDRLRILADTRDKAHRDLQALARAHPAELESLDAELRRRRRSATLRALSRETPFLFVLSAWTAGREVAGVRERLEKAVGGVLVIPAPGNLVTEPAPLAVRNPPLIAPYELFLRVLPLTPQTRVDPTPFIALSFPTFVGLMVGDIGYGAVLAALGLLVRRWGRRKSSDGIDAAGSILLHCGLSAAAFGVLFGEVFGLSKEIRIAPLLFDRRQTPLAYLLLVMGIAVGHLLTGYLVGMEAALRSRDWRRGARLVGEIASILGLGLLLARGAGVVPASLLVPGLAVLAIALMLLIYAAGYAGPFEIPAALAGLVSYLRLFAVGLASASLAQTANHIGGLMGSAILGVVTAVLLHIVFLISGLAMPLVQAARLQLVEFGGRVGLHGSEADTPPVSLRQRPRGPDPPRRGPP